MDVTHDRGGCSVVRLYWASEGTWYPALHSATEGLKEHLLGDLVEQVRAGDLHTTEQAAMLPPGFKLESRYDTPVLVGPGSSDSWLAANAIAVANLLTEGRYVEMESRAADFLLDQRHVRHSCAISTRNRCDRVSPQRSGRVRLLEVPEVPAQSAQQGPPCMCCQHGSLETHGMAIRSTFDLPTRIRAALLASLFSRGNFFKVTAAGLTWSSPSASIAAAPSREEPATANASPASTASTSSASIAHGAT